MSVTPDAVGMRSETTTHDRVWRKVPRVPCPPRHPSVRPARSHSLPVERLLPGPLRHPSLPGVSLFRRFCCYLDRPPALHGPLRHLSPPGVSLFRCFRCYLNHQPARHGPLRHPSLPGVSLFRHFRCYLGRPHALQSLLRLPSLPGVSRVTQAPGPALWQRAHRNRQPPAMLLC